MCSFSICAATIVVVTPGHINVMYIGMVGNFARFLYVSYLKSPWWVLPFEFLQGTVIK